MYIPLRILSSWLLDLLYLYDFLIIWKYNNYMMYIVYNYYIFGTKTFVLWIHVVVGLGEIWPLKTGHSNVIDHMILDHTWSPRSDLVCKGQVLRTTTILYSTGLPILWTYVIACVLHVILLCNHEYQTRIHHSRNPSCVHH